MPLFFPIQNISVGVSVGLLRDELNKREIHVEGCHYHPEMLGFVQKKYLVSEDEAYCLLKRITDERKDGNGTETTFRSQRNMKFEDQRMRYALWQTLREVDGIISRESLSLQQIRRGISPWYGTPADPMIVYRVGVLCIRLHKSLVHGRKAEQTFTNGVRDNTYLRTCTSSKYSDVLKFGKTSRCGIVRASDNNGYGKGVVLLEVPYNLEKRWKEEFKEFRVKGRASNEILKEEALELIVDKYAKFSIGGSRAQD